MALSLFVLLDGEIADQRFRVLTFFYMGSMVCALLSAAVYACLAGQ